MSTQQLRSRQLALGVVGGVALTAGGFAAWRWYCARRDRMEANEMFDDAACARAAQAHRSLEQQPVAVLHESALKRQGPTGATDLAEDGWETESEHQNDGFDEGSELERLEEEAAVIYERDLRKEWKKLLARRAKLISEGKGVPADLDSKLEDVSRELDEIRDWRAQRSTAGGNHFEAGAGIQQRRPFGQAPITADDEEEYWGSGGAHNSYYNDEDEADDDALNWAGGPGYPEEEEWFDDDDEEDAEARELLNNLFFGSQRNQPVSGPRHGQSTVEELHDEGADDEEDTDIRPRGQTAFAGRAPDPAGDIMLAYEQAYRQKLRQQQAVKRVGDDARLPNTQAAGVEAQDDEAFATASESEEDEPKQRRHESQRNPTKKALKPKAANKASRKSNTTSTRNREVVYL